MIQLHGYWRSSTSYRTRIALHLKGVDYEQVPVDLLIVDQLGEAYRSLNPQGLVPASEADGVVLTQGPAVFEWREERYPNPPLLPTDVTDCAAVRAIAALIGCDIHPLNNIRVLKAVRELDGDGDAVKCWAAGWIGTGFAALEPMIARAGGGFTWSDTPTLIDCYFVPQSIPPSGSESRGVE